MRESPENRRLIYEFGRFVLDPHERIFTADGQPIHLSDKVFDTLLLFIEHTGELLTKDEMMRALWDESFVEESNLAKNVSRLRKILSTDGVAMIETLPKHGYRFLGDVKRIDGETSLTVRRNLRVKITTTVENQTERATLTTSQPATAVQITDPTPNQLPATIPHAAVRNSRRRISMAVLVLLIALLAVALFVWKRGREAMATNETDGIVRITNNPTDEDVPEWTADNQIRFMRFTDTGRAESFVMNADGTNQRRANTEIKDLRVGDWSPDGRKVIFSKQSEDPKQLFLADTDGNHEIKLPSGIGNSYWSPDSKQFVYESIDLANRSDAELYIYTLATGKSVNITNNPAFDADPSFSPDGQQIAFSSDRDGNQEIYLMNVDGTNIRRLTNDPGRDSFPVFAPDGTQIVFTSNRESENADIYLLNVNDDSAPVKLTHWSSNEDVRRNCWSPDGTRIVFTSDRSDKSNIYVMNVEAYKTTPLLADADADLQSPSFSPDGKRIVYEARLPDKTGELRIFDLERKRATVLWKTENSDLSPAWSPDGSMIAFSNKIAGNTEICVIKPNGSELKNLTRNAARDLNPVWSSNGQEIIFASNRDPETDQTHLFRMHADGSEARRITQKSGYEATPAFSPDGDRIAFAGDRMDGKSQALDIFSLNLNSPNDEVVLCSRRLHDSLPVYSPDGKHIAFVSQSDGNAEIYLMNSDGTRLLRLTRNAAHDTTPQWSKDGQQLIFSSNRNGKFALYQIEIPKSRE